MGKLIMKMKNNKNQGQVAIIVLLVSAILLTLGISASQRTITETKIETDEEALKEAFNTAESGINNYLDTKSANYTTDGSEATVVSSAIGGNGQIVSDGQVAANSNQLFWLVNHNEDGSVGTNYYGSNTVKLTFDTNYTGSIKIDYFYVSGGTYQVKRWGYNENGSNTVNGFNASSGSSVDIDLSAGSPLLLSVTPIDKNTNLTLSGSSNFPQQGEELTSTGVTNSGVKTQVKTRYIYQVPVFFMEAVTAANMVE